MQRKGNSRGGIQSQGPGAGDQNGVEQAAPGHGAGVAGGRDRGRGSKMASRFVPGVPGGLRAVPGDQRGRQGKL